jgi:hypothetical protein
MSLAFPPNSPTDAAEFFGAMNNRGDQEFPRKKDKMSYASDGRKMRDGILMKCTNLSNCGRNSSEEN